MKFQNPIAVDQMNFIAAQSSEVINNSIFLDSTDNILKKKDDVGVITPLGGIGGDFDPEKQIYTKQHGNAGLAEFGAFQADHVSTFTYRDTSSVWGSNGVSFGTNKGYIFMEPWDHKVSTAPGDWDVTKWTFTGYGGTGTAPESTGISDISGSYATYQNPSSGWKNASTTCKALKNLMANGDSYGYIAMGGGGSGSNNEGSGNCSGTGTVQIYNQSGSIATVKYAYQFGNPSAGAGTSGGWYWFYDSVAQTLTLTDGAGTPVTFYSGANPLDVSTATELYFYSSGASHGWNGVSSYANASNFVYIDDTTKGNTYYLQQIFNNAGDGEPIDRLMLFNNYDDIDQFTGTSPISIFASVSEDGGNVFQDDIYGKVVPLTANTSEIVIKEEITYPADYVTATSFADLPAISKISGIFQRNE